MDIKFLSSIEKLFQYYKTLGQNTFDQLSDEQLSWRSTHDENSIYMIVNHMWGNMMSRWTDFLNSDGEKEWRSRESEFEDVILSRREMETKWEEGWSVLFKALESIDGKNIDKTVYIRNEGHTIPEALHRQLAHYSYHIGQIVYIGKVLSADKWCSLSIPKGKSKDYNELKFSKTKKSIHFTDEI